MSEVCIHSDFITGQFVKELKNRFLCEVLIDGTPTECYVPSSCHLSNFLALRGKQVLLLPTQAQNARTKYALFAVHFKRSYIVVNTSMANRVIEEGLHGRRFSFLGKRNDVAKECTVHGYKADLYIRDTNTIIEIKSVISLASNAVFPTVYSERTLSQLRKLQELLRQGEKACLFIVSLHPYVTEITLDKGTPFYKELVCCMELGMKLAGFTCRLHNGLMKIEKEVPVR